MRLGPQYKSLKKRNGQSRRVKIPLGIFKLSIRIICAVRTLINNEAGPTI
jgi:hypothetical protein